MNPPPTLPQIDKIVVLMLENRSLDNVLGWLHPPGTPLHLWPEGTTPDHYQGIPDNALNTTADGWPYRPSEGFHLLGPDRWRVPRWDPNEGIIDVHRQMYGDLVGGFTDRWPDGAPMSGFVRDFASSSLEGSAGEVMGAYTAEELPVLYGLANNFAVSDRWFGSMPTETDPNRAFSLCGAAEGAEYEVPPKIFEGPTLFNGLNPTGSTSVGRSWAIYYRVEGAGSFAPAGSCYTVGRFKGVQQALGAADSRGVVRPYDTLLRALRSDADIPDFCYVEPYWGWGVGYDDGSDFVGMQGTDYHPPAWMGPAEWALNELYVALRASRHWEQMLFVIVFDEHGGTYDHVAPPPAANPHGKVATWPVKFDYTRMGPRVPALLVSPFVHPLTVFRAPLHSGASFDHTSILKTVLRWANCDPTFIASLGARVGAAPMFDGVISPTIVQPSAVSDFHPPAAFVEQCPLGAHNLPFSASGLDRTASDLASAGATNVQDYLAALSAQRP